MKLTIYQSDKGDCLLLSAGTKDDPYHVLIDGGMGVSYTTHVAKKLTALPKLDVVYVSHIDEDHISGVLQMMDDALEWRIYDYRQKKGISHPKPDARRPPPLDRIWHNAFHDQITKNSGPIEDMAIATASLAAASPELMPMAIRCQELANSVPQAIQLSQRISTKQLKLKHNEKAGKLLEAGNGQKTIKVGPMTFTIIGPFRDELVALRKEWNEWLSANQARVKKLRAKAFSDSAKLAVGSFEDVEAHLAARASDLGDRTKVTVPNLASLMFLAEEDGRSILLTGDGHWQTILNGLEKTKKMPKGGGLHVNVLKVQHHGSENNLTLGFCQRVTADNYVFCGNGAHDNPDLAVIDAIVASRNGSTISGNPQAKKKYKLWFNSHASVTKTKLSGYMDKVEARVKQHAAASHGQMTFAFLKEDAFPAWKV
jgi:hypothetical protein